MPDDFSRHAPCMLAETLRILDPQPGQVALDMTTGLAGHAAAILEKTAPDGMLLGLDLDPQMLALAAERLACYGDRVRLHEANFVGLPGILREDGIECVDVALLDAGVARPQLVDPERGFGFEGTTLDMRLSPSVGRSAYEVVNDAPEAELRDILRLTQTQRESKLIAGAICRARRQKAIETSGELADLIVQAVGRPAKGSKRQPASAMLAIRAFVNQELENLEAGVEAMARALRPGSGRMIVLVYHSLEFRIARQVIERLERGHDTPPWLPEPPDVKPIIKRLVKKPLKPSAGEPVQCRSCRVFAAEAL